MLQTRNEREVHREGELYKTVELYGRTFLLYYGYYEECDRKNPLCEPIPIYPDFNEQPIYTDAVAALEEADKNNSEALAKDNELALADAENKATLEAKDSELQTFIIIVCVISGVAFCGCGTLAVFYFIDKKKKS